MSGADKDTEQARTQVLDAASSATTTASTALERPEVQAGVAFAGGLVVAQILKRLGS